MRLLLDTQVALWWLTGSPRLSKTTRDLLAGSACVLSVASVWEVAIKHRLAKLPIPPGRFRDEMRSAGATILALTDDQVVTQVDLPVDHPDPFDRLLIAVAASEHLILITADRTLVALAEVDPRLPIRQA